LLRKRFFFHHQVTKDTKWHEEEKKKIKAFLFFSPLSHEEHEGTLRRKDMHLVFFVALCPWW
jgi:hypothetical protein